MPTITLTNILEKTKMEIKDVSPEIYIRLTEVSDKIWNIAGRYVIYKLRMTSTDYLALKTKLKSQVTVNDGIETFNAIMTSISAIRRSSIYSLSEHDYWDYLVTVEFLIL